MARSTINDQLFLNDGRGRAVAIATGTFHTKAIDMSERRRLSVTANFAGGFTGIFLVQGTDEVGNCSLGADVLAATGACVAWVGAGQQPGQNGYSGAKYWNTIPSGALAITNATNSVLLSFTEVSSRWIRLVFNDGITTAIGSAVGSGSIELFITAKNT